MYMILVAVLYLIILAVLDRWVSYNRGYREPLCPNISKRKKSVYRRISEQSSEQDLEPMVSIINLQKMYTKKIHALRGVSVELNRG